VAQHGKKFTCDCLLIVYLSISDTNGIYKLPIRNRQQLNSSNFVVLRSVIAKLLPSGYPDINKVAELRGASVRTLQRRLSDAGINYSELVEKARYTEACHLLESTHIPLAEIAKNLGYKDQSSFSRAFRRWQGISPRDYRKSLRSISEAN